MGGNTLADGGVGGGGELTQERVGVGQAGHMRIAGVVRLVVRGVAGLVDLLVIGVLAVGLLVVHVQAGGGLVAVVLLQAQQAGLEDFHVALGLAGPVIFALVTPGGDLLGLQGRLGDGGGDTGSDHAQGSGSKYGSGDGCGGCQAVGRPVSMSSAYPAWGL